MAHTRPDKMTDADWEAEWDANTLSNAEVIKADEKRFKKAVAWAAILVEHEKAEAEAMDKIANMSTTPT